MDILTVIRIRLHDTVSFCNMLPCFMFITCISTGRYLTENKPFYSALFFINRLYNDIYSSYGSPGAVFFRQVTTRESGCNFTFDFSQVYWNPRLREVPASHIYPSHEETFFVYIYPVTSTFSLYKIKISIFLISGAAYSRASITTVFHR